MSENAQELKKALGFKIDDDFLNFLVQEYIEQNIE